MHELLLVTVSDAEILLKRTISHYEAMAQAAQDLLSHGYKNIFMLGEQLHDPLFTQDYWTNGQDSFWLASPRYSQKNNFEKNVIMSAISSYVWQGYAIKDAIIIAKMCINRCCRLEKNFNEWMTWPEDEIDLPYLAHKPFNNPQAAFKHITTDLGLYPVVDSAHWVERLLNAGVKTIQLRIKEPTQDLEIEIKNSVDAAKKQNAKLFINDYWELAIKHDAYGIHLGQEDLQRADLKKIHSSGLHLGVSSHCYYEVARAHAINPSYIACGPIYPTTSKEMSFMPQGISQLSRWRRTLHYPLVAIGGITLERLPDVLSTGVQGIALISAITKSSDPINTTKQFLKIIGKQIS